MDIYKILRDIEASDDGVLYVKLPDSTEVVKTSIKRVGQGGSKMVLAMDISDSLVLVLGNTDVSLPLYWPVMCAQEVLVSQQIQAHGLLTANNQATTIYLDHELTQDVPAYFSDSFAWLASRQQYVIDTKSDILWKGGFFQDHDDMMTNIDLWKHILSIFINEIDTMYKISIPRSGDSINYIVIEGHLRYFGFDFASKSGGCLIIKEEHDESKYEWYKYKHILYAIEYLMFQEYEAWGKRKMCIPSEELYTIAGQIYPQPTEPDSEPLAGCIMC